MFKVNLMLADAAQVAEGKLNALGAGWSIIIPGAPFAVCGIIDIPWHLGTDWHKLRLELVDADGEAVCVPSGEDTEPVVFEPPPYRVTIGPHVKPGSWLSWPFAANVGPGMPLQPGSLYEWRLTIDGKAEDGWTLPFQTVGEQHLRAA